MKNSALILLICFVVLGTNSLAQNPAIQWANSMGGNNLDRVLCLNVDVFGNIYTTGYFEGTSDFDPGPGTFNLISNGGTDIFICKLNSAGQFVWAKSFGGMNMIDMGISIVTDVDGNIFFTGTFEGTVDFDPDTGIFILSEAGMGDIFISKLDSSGNLVWAKALGDIYSDYGNSIAIDNQSNIYITGSFQSTVDFDPGPGTMLKTSFGSKDVFLSKLDSTGNLIWCKTFGGSGPDQGNYIVFDSLGYVFVGGDFWGTVDFNPDSLTNIISSNGSYDAFISKYNSSGNLVWTKAFGGSIEDHCISIAVEANNNVYAGGYFEGTSDFDPDSGIFSLTSEGFFDSFISKLDNSGNLVWARSIGGIGYEYLNSLSLDRANNIYTIGSFTASSDFDPSSASNYDLMSAGGWDIYMSSIDSSGAFLSAVQIGGANSELGGFISTDDLNNIYLTGCFSSPTINCDSIQLLNSDSVLHHQDIFIAKYSNTITSIAENFSTDVLTLYPNPASNIITIEFSSSNLKGAINIFNMMGKIVYSTFTLSSTINVNLEGLIPGVYLISVEIDGKFFKEKFIKLN